MLSNSLCFYMEMVIQAVGTHMNFSKINPITWVAFQTF